VDLMNDSGLPNAARLLLAVAWRVVFLTAALIVVGVIPLATSPAHAVNGSAGDLTLTAEPNVHLVDGQTVSVHVQATNVSIYSLTTHICIPGKVNGDYAFSFSGPFCSKVAVGSGTVQQQVITPGTQTADLAVKVGEGTANWINERGFPYSVTCDPTTSCDLVVQVEITNSTVYAQVPLCYATVCAAAPVEFVGPPGVTGGATVVSPVAGTSSATPPGVASSASGTASNPSPAATHPALTGESRSSTPAGAPTRLHDQATTITGNSGLSRGLRVLIAGLVAALGGMRIMSVINKHRRQSAPQEGM
jgi:hypothetical protein